MSEAINLEKDVLPAIREMLAGVAHRFAGEPVLRPAFFIFVVCEAMKHLTAHERATVIRDLSERYGRYVQ